MNSMFLLKTPFSTGSAKEPTQRAGMTLSSITFTFTSFGNPFLKYFIGYLMFSCGKCRRQTFVKSLEPFVNWLEEAEEED